MKNRFPAFLAIACISASILYSCQKDASNVSNDANGPRMTKIFLTDHQTPTFDSVFIDMQKLEVKVHDDSAGQDRWIDLPIRPGVYNVLRFRNGLDTIFASGMLPTTRLQKIRLTLGTQNSVMINNVRSSLRLHDDDRQVIIDLTNTNFEVNATGDIVFWIDFDAAQSIQVDNSGPGNNNGYRLRSHISVFTRGHSGEIEGRVLPAAARAIVKAYRGTDTATAIPFDHNGEFKIVGLSEGTYKVLIDGQNGYNDTLLQNIIVRKGEDTHLPTIVLHP